MKESKFCKALLGGFLGVAICGSLPVHAAVQPVITNTVLSTEGLVFSGTGGEPDGKYWVVSSTDAAVAVTNWPAISTNDFDAIGNFSSTNTFDPDLFQSYFSIRTVEAGIDFGLIGYGEGTTGGTGAATQTVTTAAALISALQATAPAVVQVQGSITFSSVSVKNNKTLIGLGTNATLTGTVRISGSTNVIIRNLHISNPTGAEGSSDGVGIDNFAHHIWVDHCSFGECTDGQIDITHGADWVTVSWCTFSYTNAASGHRFSSLVGHNADNAGEDAGRLHVTYHHNWWSTLVHERTPRVRYGRIHALNNLFWSPGNNYCIRASLQSEVLSENNYFKQVDEPYDKITELGETGLIKSLGSEFEDCTNVIVYNDTVFTPPYAYVADPAASVPDLVTSLAGAGKGPFAP